MREYNIPNLWKKDIATCGIYPDEFSRDNLWYQWSDIQKLHATSRYNPVFDRLEELCKLKEDHLRYFGCFSSVWLFGLNQVIDIDFSKQYTTAQLLKLVDDAIEKENKSYEKELNWVYSLSLED